MNVSLVLTLTGLDKPGLVNALSATVSAHGANWEESRMAQLAGHFAGILHVSAPKARVDALVDALVKLETQGLSVRVERGTRSFERSGYRPFLLEVVGNDRPGIVREISGILCEHGVNVEELSTQRVSAPHDGGMLFIAEAKLLSPPSLGVEQLRSLLESLANDLMVELAPDNPAGEAAG